MTARIIGMERELVDVTTASDDTPKLEVGTTSVVLLLKLGPDESVRSTVEAMVAAVGGELIESAGQAVAKKPAGPCCAQLSPTSTTAPTMTTGIASAAREPLRCECKVKDLSASKAPSGRHR